MGNRAENDPFSEIAEIMKAFSEKLENDPDLVLLDEGLKRRLRTSSSRISGISTRMALMVPDPIPDKDFVDLAGALRVFSRDLRAAQLFAEAENMDNFAQTIELSEGPKR